ncbi:MAG: peptide chain release factor 1 [Nitrospinaceae bacterium]|nr:peptide chain release factor 1 [Nitrospinaceae bacterium]NIR53369.1 peptide chain release factor 1 [Nitrospinaceae bacterium]NIS83773.1 peptide chain release factor 1 [Nitrospinaceae bacterium]NIT80572.1 peptide chain release factor 1 [Nitrospinaceae bacterium]NIU42893.1 peptide chain release factor 1 [Nitrospinaceae bacterium]
MFEQLKKIEKRFEELNRLMSDPEITRQPTQYQKLAREQSEILPVVREYQEWQKNTRQLEENQEILTTEKDGELLEMAEEEIEALKPAIESNITRLKVLLLPKDPRDEKNVIMEIRAGTGGDEAGLFSADLFRMYSRYAESKKWKVEVMNISPTGVGGIKEVICSIQGKGVYSKLKFEAGTHRVQRVPTTETQGRIHTSAVTVAILPEAEDVDIQINPADLKIDVYRSSGPGGQSVNTTDSAVRITHMPSGIVVTCQDEKSQHKNKDRAMKVLRARLYDEEQRKQQQEKASDRKQQIGSGDRSERIRTYNFPQERVTDHRIGLTLHKLSLIMEGDLDELIEKLVMCFQAEALKGSQN